MSIYKSRFQEAGDKIREGAEDVRGVISKQIKEKQRRRKLLQEATLQGELRRARQGFTKGELKQLRSARSMGTPKEDPFQTVGTMSPIDFTKTGRGKIDLLRPR